MKKASEDALPLFDLRGCESLREFAAVFAEALGHRPQASPTDPIFWKLMSFLLETWPCGMASLFCRDLPINPL